MRWVTAASDLETKLSAIYKCLVGLSWAINWITSGLNVDCFSKSGLKTSQICQNMASAHTCAWSKHSNYHTTTQTQCLQRGQTTSLPLVPLHRTHNTCPLNPPEGGSGGVCHSRTPVAMNWYVVSDDSFADPGTYSNVSCLCSTFNASTTFSKVISSPLIWLVTPRYRRGHNLGCVNSPAS